MTDSGSSPSFELGLRIMEGLPTIRELIALVNTNPFLGTDRICS